jgi:hypothetical protein
MLRVRDALDRQKISTRAAYAAWAEGPGVFPGHEISGTLLELPSRSNMSDTDIDGIVSAIRAQLVAIDRVS